MNLLFFWISTSIISLFMEVINEAKIYKDAADEGFKIKAYKLAISKYRLGTNIEKLIKPSFVSTLIPIYNIIQVLDKAFQYNNNREIILDQLYTISALEEMNDEEQRKYQDNPTLLNAYFLNKRTQIEEAKMAKIIVSTDVDDYEIFFEQGDTIDDIKIIKVSGTAAKLSLDEQKEIVINTIKENQLNGKYNKALEITRGDITGKIFYIMKNSFEDIEIVGAIGKIATLPKEEQREILINILKRHEEEDKKRKEVINILNGNYNKDIEKNNNNQEETNDNNQEETNDKNEQQVKKLTRKKKH